MRASWTGPLLGCLVASGLMLDGPTASYAQQPSGETPPSVIVTPVELQDVTRKVRFVGTVEALQLVDVRARVEGFLESVNFEAGAFVQKNAVLYQIERAPSAAAVAQAHAAHSAAEAQLASSKAALLEREATFVRQRTLAQQQFAAQAALDLAQAQRDQAAASVQEADAQIESANAEITKAELNLSYTTMVAPITGRIGKTANTVGNLVSPSTGVLATIVQMSPIGVTFSIPEGDYVRVTRFIMDRDGKSAASTDDVFKPMLTLPDGTQYNQQGKIEFINNQVNTSTGTVSVRAIFPNPDNLLLPGQFVSVDVQIGEARSLPVVPQAAIQQDASGQYVFVVDDQNRVQIRRITTGIRTDKGVAVDSGLKQGEMIIVNGVQKVRPGVVVAPGRAPVSKPAELKQ